MRFSTLAILAALAATASGCATDRNQKPLLTAHALSRAAATCHVESLGIRRSKGSKVPYGDYLLPASEVGSQVEQRESPACMADALGRYKYQFLGQVEKRPAR